jgi:sugar lactone lactonase YvrE
MRSARAFHSEASLKAKNLILRLKDGPTANKTLQLGGGLLKVRPSVDSIALSTDGAMLYYSSVADTKLYVVPTEALISALEGSITNDQVANAVRVVSDKKTSSDGLTMDLEDNVYVSDFENSAINVYPTNGGSPYILAKSPSLLRWPDGFSFGPDRYLYVSCSCLQYDMAGLNYKDYAPFQILRIKVDVDGTIGM